MKFVDVWVCWQKDCFPLKLSGLEVMIHLPCLTKSGVLTYLCVSGYGVQAINPLQSQEYAGSSVNLCYGTSSADKWGLVHLSPGVWYFPTSHQVTDVVIRCGLGSAVQ